MECITILILRAVGYNVGESRKRPFRPAGWNRWRAAPDEVFSATIRSSIPTSSVDFVDSFPEGGAWSIGAERQCGTPDKRSAVRYEGPQGEAFVYAPPASYFQGSINDMSDANLKLIKDQNLFIISNELIGCDVFFQIVREPVQFSNEAIKRESDLNIAAASHNRMIKLFKSLLDILYDRIRTHASQTQVEQ